MSINEILEVENYCNLSRLLNKGLIQLYQEIFAEPPEYQIWPEVKLSELFSFYQSSGHLFVAVARLEQPIGFCAILPLTVSSIWQTVVSDGFSTYTLNQDFLYYKFGIDSQSAWYVADLGVAAQHRKLGLGTKLIQRAIACRKPMLLRVSLVRSQAIALYNRVGFEPINLFQKANYKQQNGSVKTFEKMLMLIK
ncbi:GNAT family N-acetyltransferase [Planktothrix sp. FACHB-1355]|uniref:GNAT family N-acetyltransferase n=1 Tax=Aerosakkonema funiforme FACHB-1375 TaxID=2949571 RepID=A0A926ZH72_9CYAN|nr:MULTISPECIES: GNAT family N-acetyltransferase [Oscillatoriales]MBD2180606.1 GNAT family N-acetyltransferase [Aerosakkonema funiforme FACHB-1375]MBD3557634.1 GNAT family N-acetyltransferase [Planktothrix sp. FACHB-1355]